MWRLAAKKIPLSLSSVTHLYHFLSSIEKKSHKSKKKNTFFETHVLSLRDIFEWGEKNEKNGEEGGGGGGK